MTEHFPAKSSSSTIAFSIITPDRTVDLEADTELQKQKVDARADHKIFFYI